MYTCKIRCFVIDTDTDTETGLPGSRFQNCGIVAALIPMENRVKLLACRVFAALLGEIWQNELVADAF